MSGVEIDSQPPQINKKNYKPYSSETLASLGQEQSPQDGQALWFLGFVDFEPHCAPRPRQIHNSGVAAATTGCLRLVPGKTLCEGTLKTKETEAEVPKML